MECEGMWACWLNAARWIMFSLLLTIFTNSSLGENPLRNDPAPNATEPIGNISQDTAQVSQPAVAEVGPVVVPLVESQHPFNTPAVGAPAVANNGIANNAIAPPPDRGNVGQQSEIARQGPPQGLSYFNLGAGQLFERQAEPQVFRIADADSMLKGPTGACDPSQVSFPDPPFIDDYWTSNWIGQYVLVSTEATFLHSHFVGASLSADNAGQTAHNNGAFEDMTFAPRVCLAYQRSEWGLLGRFWYLSDGVGDFSPLGINGSNTGLNASNRLKMYTADVEANRQWIWVDRAVINTSVGVRYASLSTDGILSSVAVTGSDVFDSFAATSSRFNGTGVTSGITARVPIACNDWLCRGCTFSLFGELRGSAVFGNANSNASTANRIVTIGAVASTADADVASRNSTLLIGETQFGIEWDRQLRCLPATAFFRLAGEYQIWSGSSTADSNASTTLSAGGGTSSARARAGGIDLSLFGVSAATGFVW